MYKKIIECVPNFSEGRDMSVIKQITDAIESVEGVKLLNVDPGAATNRTVVTFVGEPNEVCQAAFRGIKKAAELIDMSKHHGEHPRMGATDVCPLIPVAGISMEETVIYARELAKRVGEELSIPVYCYESAAFTSQRKNLAACRDGEYEGLKIKISSAQWKPDFGPSAFDKRITASGATAIGARDFLVAVNFNLNTTSVRRANAIAYDVREKGRKKREGNSLTGKVILDNNGKEEWIPGSLKGCKAIGWFIQEYGIAQVSMNVTDITATPLHAAFDEVVSKAETRGIRVTGSEIVGLVPKKVLIEAGRFYLHKQQRSTGVSEAELIKIAIKSMGLDDLAPFDPKQKVIEYLMEESVKKQLVNLTCKEFALETASESPAPGGGSVAACMGSFGAALGTMVANLSSHKAGWDHKWAYFSDWADKGQEILSELLYLVDEDTNAFNRIMDAFALPKSNQVEISVRSEAIQKATLYATEIPLKTIKVAYNAFDLIEVMAKDGNPNSISDAGVGAIAIRGAIYGAYLNVRINASGLKDKLVAEQLTTEAQNLLDRAFAREKVVTDIVLKTIAG